MNKRTIDFDSLDIALIRELDMGPRQGYQQLADELHTSRNTVRRRLKRLIDENMVIFVTLTSPPALGYQTHSTMAIMTQPGEANTVAAKLSSLSNVTHLMTTTGRYDIIAAAIFPDLESMLDFMDGQLGSVPDILSIELMILVNWMKFCLNPLTATNHAFPVVPRPHNLDALDLSIIYELETKPDRTNQELAAKLDISRPTIKKRIRSLLDDDIVRIATLVNPAIIGFHVLAVLLFKVRPGTIRPVAATLTTVNEVSNLIITAGSHDMIAYANFRDSHHLSDFINERAIRIPGVIRVESMIVHSTKKVAFSLLSQGLEPSETNSQVHTRSVM